jgi:hypothetical protein
LTIGHDDTLVGMLTLAFVLALASTLAAPTRAAVAAGECVVVAPLRGGAEMVFGGAECDRRTLATTAGADLAVRVLNTMPPQAERAR